MTLGVGSGNNLGIGQAQGFGLDGLGKQGGGVGDAKKLLQQIKQLLEQQQEGKAEEGGGAGGAKAAGGGKGGGGEDLEALLKKLREMAQKNPAALQTALNQNPQMASMLGAGLASGGGGGSAIAAA